VEKALDTLAQRIARRSDQVADLPRVVHANRREAVVEGAVETGDRNRRVRKEATLVVHRCRHRPDGIPAGQSPRWLPTCVTIGLRRVVRDGVHVDAPEDRREVRVRLEGKHGGAPEVLGPAHRHGTWILKLCRQAFDPEVDPLVATGWVSRVRGQKYVPAAVQEAGDEAMTARVLGEKRPYGRERVQCRAAKRALQESAAAKMGTATVGPMRRRVGLVPVSFAHVCLSVRQEVRVEN